MTKVHRIALLVVDHDNLGAKDAASEIENARFPNDCLHPTVLSVETRSAVSCASELPRITSKSRAE